MRARRTPVTLVPGVSHHGHESLQCPACRKAAFVTEERANVAAEKIGTMRVYLAPCGWWHLTTRTRRDG